jgi:plastocyanin
MATILSSWRGRWLLTAALGLAAAALVLAGPGGGLAAADVTAQASGTATVDIDHFAFHPPTLTIAKGTQVAFSNSSKVAHTATRAGSFNTGHIKPGKSVLVRFTQRGTFAYHCLIHPFMHGKIVVQ